MIMSFGNSLALEFFKAGMVCIFGIISFRTFERFKNKKEATKLYIALKKLEKDIEDNKKAIQEVINEYIELEILEKHFNVDENWNEQLKKLYENISSLSCFKNFDGIDENGYVYEHYADRQYDVIRDLEGELHYCDNTEEYENTKYKLEYYRKLDIYTEFDKIYNEINKLIKNGFLINPPLDFFKKKLEKYNQLEKEKKNRYLERFCKIILEEKNDFTESLEIYREIKIKTTKLNSNDKIKLNFNTWDTIENIDILALYDVESYMEIEDLYKKLFEYININNKDLLENKYKFLEELLEHIIKHEKKLKKILRKNNRYFKDV